MFWMACRGHMISWRFGVAAYNLFDLWVTVEWQSLPAIVFGKSEWIKILVKKVRWMNRSVKRLLIETTNLDGFTLMNHGWFAKITNFPPTKHSHHTVSWGLEILDIACMFVCLGKHGGWLILPVHESEKVGSYISPAHHPVAIGFLIMHVYTI